jgi:lysozyme family protein/peptidoglycan hydrolase-like protein with peptidoglycan-binding domain
VFADETESVDAANSEPAWAAPTVDGPALSGADLAESEAPAESEGPQGAFPTQADGATYTPSGRLGRVHSAHERRLADGIELELGLRERDLGLFQAHYARHKARYEAVSAKTDMPPKLIAALHWRESSGRFDRYLHQGDPIGRPSRNIPRGILFYDWETAAIDALTQKNAVRNDIGMTAETTDAAAIATYAERYNGLGYHYKGRPSPYVYAGTGEYQAGKYVADGVYSSTHVDGQLGVLAMVGSLGGLDTPLTAPSPEAAWARVVSGSEVLRRGSRGLAVRALQEKLAAAGIQVGVDGDFGPGTHRAVVAFQQRTGLATDGVVGAGTAAALDKPGSAATPATEPVAVEETVETPAQSPEDLAWQAVVEGSKLLRMGSRGDAVEALQVRLAEQGIWTTTDGSFGPATRRSVVAFQRRQGLAADGVVGRRTAAALNR